MALLLLLILLFQLSPVVDIPVADFYAFQVAMAEKQLDRDICVTPSIESIKTQNSKKNINTKKAFSNIMRRDYGRDNPANKYLNVFSFDRLFYHSQCIVFDIPLSYHVFFSSLNFFKESKILDIDFLPS